MSVKINRHPKLRKPYMLAAWPGIGYVATSVAVYIKEALGAEELAEIEPYEFFRPNGVSVKNNIIITQKVLENPLPQSKFYYYENPNSDHDLIIFIGEAQPRIGEWDFAYLVLDVAKHFKVERIFTSIAMVASISYSQKPAVYAAATSSELLNYLKHYNVGLSGSIKEILGLNGILLEVAQEKGIGGIGLLGEVPFYIAQLEIEYPKSSRAVLEVLSKMLEIKVDMDNINQLVEHAESEMKELEEEVIHKMNQIVIYPQNSEEEVINNAGIGQIAVEKVTGPSNLKIFSELAQSILNRSESESKRLKQDVVNTGHLMLALLKETNIIKILKNMNIDVDRLLIDIETAIVEQPNIEGGTTGLTPAIKEVIRISIAESKRLGSNQVLPQHIFLGLIRGNDGIAVNHLKMLGVTPEMIYIELIKNNTLSH